MNIYTKPGDKVVYAYPENGYPVDKAHAKRHLKFLEIYTIESIEVGDFHTSIKLIEVSFWFNSVHFEDLRNLISHDISNTKI